MNPTIKQSELAMFLTWGLKIAYSETDIRELVYLDTSSIYRTVHFKPLVIPLNKLTDEQWTNVFRVGFMNVGFEVWPIGDSFIERHANAVEIIYSGKSAFFDYACLQFDCQPFAFNQLAAFQKICELHGDLFNWLSRDLAVNKLEYLKGVEDK